MVGYLNPHVYDIVEKPKKVKINLDFCAVFDIMSAEVRGSTPNINRHHVPTKRKAQS